MPELRRTFAPVVLLGLAAGTLAAVAGTKSWVSGNGIPESPGSAAMAWGEVTSSPLSTALALVVLACWGVVLVTRGRFRRAVTALSVIAAVGNAVTVALASGGLRDRLSDEVLLQTGAELDSTQLTAWFWIAVPAALLVVLTTAVAVKAVPAWPEMGTKYDAPAGAVAPTDAPPETNIDIWKALDEGRDPTA